MTDAVRWYFDVVSPFAYLQWRALRAGALPLPVIPVPILFAGVLDHWGQKGPAEIPGKRRFTYRFVTWRAGRAGLPFRFPPAHPFNPLAALRLCLAADASPAAIDAVLGHVWAEGRAGDTVDALAPVATALGIADPAAAVADPAVKAALRANTEAAIAAGVFGVPTLAIGAELFWGEDATTMAAEFLADPERFAEPEWRRLDALPMAARRI